MSTLRALLTVLSTLALVSVAQAEPLSTIRLETGVSGHIHPALCRTKKGTLVAVFCKSEYKPYLITRSTDGGKSWSKPELFGPTQNSQVYPGSLTALADGRIVHAWNEWFTGPENQKSRYVAWSTSSDEGLTWSEPKSLARPKDLKTGSVVRHPLVELSANAWLFSLADRTIVYNPESGEETPLGDGTLHGLTPIVRTAKGSLVSGKGLRSTDGGKSWQKVKSFPDVATQGWRHEMFALASGVLMASQVVGPGVGGDRFEFLVSRDDGLSWDFEHLLELHNPGRPIGGRACPRTVELDDRTLGTIFYDTDPDQQGGSGVFFRTLSSNVALAQAEKKPPAAKPVKELILPGEAFLVGDRPAFILLPPEDKRSRPQPWIFYGPTLAGLPDGHEKWMHEQFLAAGVAVAGIDVGEAYGSPKGREGFTALYRQLVDQRGFAAKPCMLGRSRGGLLVTSWAAANPDLVSGIAGIYPVIDFRTYPGLERAAPAYGLSAEELGKKLAEHNPIERLAALAKAKVPVLLIHGDDDKVVPLKENSAEFAARYKAEGAEASATVIVAKGQGHNYWEGFFRSKELVDFAIARAKAGAQPAK